MFEEVAGLFENREVPGNLDRAIELLSSLEGSHPGAAEIPGRIAYAYYYKGHFASAKADKDRLFSAGREAGQRAIDRERRSIWGNYWFAANSGMLGMVRGVRASIKGVAPMRQALEIALEVDELYYHGGPHRSSGRLFHKAPGWPISIGDKKKARHHLERAVEIAPSFFHNRLFLAELYLALHAKREAREQLDWLIAAAVDPVHAMEEGAYQRQALELRSRL